MIRRLLMAAVLAGVLLGVIEGLYVGHVAAGYFDGKLEWLRFFTTTVSLGGLGGLGAGLLVTVVALLTIGSRARSVAAVAALLTAPYAIWTAQAMFQGGKARTMAGRPLLMTAWALLLCALTAVAVVLARRLVAASRQWRLGRRLLVLLVLAVLALLLYEANQHILPRLYLFFHTTLTLASFALLLVAFEALGLQPAPLPFVLAGLLLVGGGSALFATLGQVPVVRSLLIDRAVVVSALAKQSPAPRRRIAAHNTTTVSAPLPPPPHLDGDLVLITVDAMRADRLTAALAPRMNALAQAGVRVERAYAQVPHTSFSVATLMTGKYVYSLSQQGAALDHETLAEILRRERFKTAAFFPPAVFFIDRDKLADFERSSYGFEYVKYEFLAAAARTDQVIHFLESEQPKRAFLWVHYLEPHEPYDVHPGGPPASASDRERYDGEVHFVDGEVGRLVDYLRVHRPGALVIIAADHGEEMGEHGGRYHGTTVYEEQTRIPLVLSVLGDPPWPQRVVPGPVGLVDIVPTVLGLFGITPSVKVQGRSFAPWLNPVPLSAPLGPTFSEVGSLKMVTDGHDKLICNVDADSCALYDLTVDPGEKHNLGGGPRADALRGQLDDWMARQLRFESSSADELLAQEGSTGAEGKRAIERGRRGERGATGGLVKLLIHPSPVVRREAARLIDQLPVDATARSALAQAVSDSDGEVAREAIFALCRQGDAPTCEKARGLAQAACAGGQSEVCGHGALALHDASLAAIALGQLHDQLELQLQLLDELAESHTADALAPLLVALADVRLRFHTIGALVRFGDPRTVDIFARWVAHEPYVEERAAMATALGQFAASNLGGERNVAIAALDELAQSEREAPVMAAAVAALARAHAPSLVSPNGALGPAETWVVGRGDVREGQTLRAQAGADVVQSDPLAAAVDHVWQTHITLPRRARWTFTVADGTVESVYLVPAGSRPNARTQSR